MGMRDSENDKSFILEFVFYFMIFIPLEFLTGIIMIYQLMHYYSNQNPAIIFYVKPKSYGHIGLILVIMLLFLILLQFRKIRKIKITKITKERMFG
ncbi:MAG: FtsX-like permease family protein [Promethearchaeota archaeon]